MKSYEDIINEYSMIRQKNLYEFETKKNKIYDDYPILKKYDFDIISLYVKSTLNKDKKIDDEISKLKKEREKYLKSINLDDDYLEIHYDCPKCKDTGFIDGKKCSCFAEKESDIFDKLTRINEIVKKDNFEKFDESCYNQDIVVNSEKKIFYKDYMHRVLEHINDSIKNFNTKPYNAIFIGSIGTGKTFLARCIAAEILKKNKSVLYLNVNEYLDSLKPNYNGVPFDKHAINTDLFILDDLGTESPTQWTNEKLDYIINKRLDDNKSTIITTKLLGKDLRNIYLESMASRIIHMYTKYILMGADLRGIKNAND